MKYDKKNFKYYIIIVLLIVLCILNGALSVKSTIQSNKLRAANYRLTERLDRATDTCTEFRGTIKQCQSICRDLDELSERNIGTTRDAIEIIEETREAVGAMEVALGLFDSDGYYNWLDSYVLNSEIK